ncbi:DUF4232 domain-containing protein [Nocardioides albus]|uniref:DUF4232 domain-containing protein n=1 Tax=Nocardioides albus TaxID=1841 RepID=A0A7W5F978_9ACTN|nr:DUF4232 domain-containing protein [Nocardioides albus]MBB3089965.1 hypothetical protein [Nocardioides albus]GGU36895.1 hypothetical protein GCM10007979_40100 [Nocardioides albus]
MPTSFRHRIAPLVLATATTALAASACSSETADDGGEQSSPRPSTEPATEATTEPTTEPDQDSEESGGVCATGDLSFTVSEESQAGGYYLITASAEPGVTCTLEGRTIEAGFGSGLSGDVKPSEQAEGEPITMTGSTKAYAGVNPHSGPQEGGVQFEEIIVSAHEGDMDPVSLKLPSPAEVDQPIGTNWHTDAAKAVPFSS